MADQAAHPAVAFDATVAPWTGRVLGRRYAIGRLLGAGALVGQSDHGVSLSLYAKDPDGLEFEVFWTVPGGEPVGTRALDLEHELARRGIAMPAGASA